MNDISDSELMLKFIDGNVHAFEMLFQRYRVPLFNFLYRMVNRQREQAEDLLQEAFLRVAKAKGYYEPTARFSTWLFTIARNTCLNFLKSRQHQHEALSYSLDRPEPESETALADRLSSQVEVLKDVESREFQKILEHAISRLPSHCKEAFLLHAVEGFSHEEIAVMLNTNPATIRTHYHRARMMLKDIVMRASPNYGGTK